MYPIVRGAALALFIYACAPAAAEHLFYRHSSFDIVAGRNTYIYKKDELSADCAVLHFTTKVETSPAHGKLFVSHGPVPNGYKKPRPQAKCPYMVSDGVSAYYQPEPGYTGKDKVVISVTDNAENKEYTTIYLSVK